MGWSSATDPRWADAGHTAIDLTVTWDDESVTRYRASSTATDPIELDLYTRAAAGEYSTVASQSTPAPLEPPDTWPAVMADTTGVSNKLVATDAGGAWAAIDCKSPGRDLLAAANTAAARTAIGVGAADTPSMAGVVSDVAAGTSAGLTFRKGGTNVWGLFAHSDAMGGSNAGANLRLYRYDDAGAALGVLLTATRASGLGVWAGDWQVSGAIQVGGANTVVDANRIHVHRSYTIATLPAAVTGGTIYCSDLGGGGGLLWSDGSAWRRLTEAGVTTVATDANFTLTPLASSPDQTHTGTLTANRTVTLSTTNAYNGARFCVSRTGGGAFTLSIGGLKSLSQNQWAEVTYSGSAWVLTAYGTL